MWLCESGGSCAQLGSEPEQTGAVSQDPSQASQFLLVPSHILLLAMKAQRGSCKYHVEMHRFYPWTVRWVVVHSEDTQVARGEPRADFNASDSFTVYHLVCTMNMYGLRVDPGQCVKDSLWMVTP
jgi:hypothetical protein